MEQWLIFAGITTLLLLIVFLLARYHGQIERKLFLIRIHSPWPAFFSAILVGVVAALVASILILLLGVQLSLQTVVGITVLSVLLSFFHIRYMSFTYAASIVSIVAYATQQGLLSWQWLEMFDLQAHFEQVLVRDLVATTGIIYLVEALLFRLQRKYSAIPTVLFGQRGRLVGGYFIRIIGFLPLIVIVPSSTGWDLSFTPDWWPLFGDDGEVSTFAISVLPIISLYMSIVVRRMPKEQLGKTSRWWLLFGVVIVTLSSFAEYVPWLLLLAAIIALLSREVYVLIAQRREKKATSLFTHNNEGLAILAVLPASPAAEMGIVPGERLVRVNGEKVTQTKEVYAALQHNAAFCKLEVLNTAGNVKFVQRSLYSGEHYLLGIILAPDDDTTSYMKNSYTSLLHLLLQKVAVKKKMQ